MPLAMERVTLPREPATPRRARHYLAPRLLSLGMPPQAAAELLVAVGEAVTNAVIHGGRGATATISRDGTVSDGGNPEASITETDVVVLELIARGDRVAVAVTNSSAHWHVPAAKLPADPHVETGRGLYVMRQFVDSIRIEQSRTGTTVYLIRRLRPDPPESDARPQRHPAATSNGHRRAG